MDFILFPVKDFLCRTCSGFFVFFVLLLPKRYFCICLAYVLTEQMKLEAKRKNKGTAASKTFHAIFSLTTVSKSYCFFQHSYTAKVGTRIVYNLQQIQYKNIGKQFTFLDIFFVAFVQLKFFKANTAAKKRNNFVHETIQK